MIGGWVKKKAARLVYNDRLAVVPFSLRANWPQRSFLKRFLSDLAIDCVLDVGANGGQYGAELRRIGYDGLVISFEPDPTAYQRLVERASQDARWHTLNIALGREAGRAQFNIMEVSLFNSFRAPSTSETGRFAGANEVKERVEVEVERLSDVLPRLRQQHGFRSAFLKMDTQGFDSEVFAGAAAVHDQILGLQSEVGIKRLYDGVGHWTDQIKTYQDAGFDLAGLYAVNPDEPEVLELDCYFRRSGNR